MRNHIDHDMVFVHDPQPLPLITHYRKKCPPWVWRCHLDLTAPNREVWNYLVPFIEKYDAVVLSCGEYRQDLTRPQVFFTPGIDPPFSIVNKELSGSAIDERLDHYGIPTDLPLVVQISRFDRWKDPPGRHPGVPESPEGGGVHPGSRRERRDRRPGRCGGLPVASCPQERTDHRQKRPGRCARERAPAAGGGRPAEVPPGGGVRADGIGGDVEGRGGDRRERRRHPPADRGREERVPGLIRRRGGGEDRPAAPRPPISATGSGTRRARGCGSASSSLAPSSSTST